MKLLHNQVALVTGAAQGIGLEICKQLARQGAHVLLNDIEAAAVEEAAHIIRKENGSCIAIAGDASDHDFIRDMVREAVSRFGQLDIAIANAGITLYQDFLEYKPEDFDQVMKVNLAGSFFLAQAVARQMKEQGTGGKIIFMSSVIGHQGYKNMAAFGMTKAALEMLAKTLVAEVSSYHITVNAIAPGATLTERTSMDKQYVKTWSEITPIGKPASMEDIANAVTFMVSPQASHITGQTLVIDGGWTSVAHPPTSTSNPSSGPLCPHRECRPPSAR